MRSASCGQQAPTWTRTSPSYVRRSTGAPSSARAETTGAALTVGPGRGGRGTTVRLTVPTGPEEGSRTP